MDYTKINWTESTPISTTNLGKMDDGISSIAQAVSNGYAEAALSVEQAYSVDGASTPVIVEFNFETADLGGLFDVTTHSFTPPVGSYLFTGSFRISLPSGDYLVRPTLFKNGGVFRQGTDFYVSSASALTSTFSFSFPLREVSGTNSYTLGFYIPTIGATVSGTVWNSPYGTYAAICRITR